ncbi:hypothetical protein PUMCH_003281 [Australozyma saopauloensis]|uniref:Presequence protease, mitochondrial n=1 Tax=Australozyma saopauloensis TaxID=291208 RepID=A0AAX4HBH8_9ASCO|nr:hypothetical protein PUMCH_003281 [[Candida] saopauloensis]
MLRRFAVGQKQTILRRNLATASGKAALSDLVSKYPVGLSLHGFAIEDVQTVPEFSLVTVQLKHTKTGLQHLHLASPTDNNNVFSVAFKTNPPNATGIPHVLEHTTLCGSYKYPVRDPFFKMLNRSLSNFMNAMTGHDYTYYPFATTNRKDYDNLMSVYLSSVYEPLLTYEDFSQEGWRLEQADMNDKNSPLEFKGVVYNEMKGQYSNSSYLYYIRFQEAIYPALKNSGGDPAKITDMQYEDLIDFHTYNYHPSNAKTFSYGTFEVKDHLEKLDEFYGLFGRRSANLDVKKSLFDSKLDDSHFHIETTGPIDTMSSKPLEEQYKASVTWNLGNPLDASKQYEIFKWRVLNSLLFDGHNAPFYQELIETGFAEDFAPNTGFDQTSQLMSFTVGLSNISREKVDNLESKIKDILQNKVLVELQKGEDSSYNERILAILHQLELSFKKHKPDFGLNLLNSILPSWVNGMNPVSLLRVQSILDRFKEDYEDCGLEIFEELLQDTILNESTRKFKFTMKPNENYNSEIQSKEAEKLLSRVENLDQEDKDLIFARSKKLLEKQQSEEDVSLLPSLSIEDIPRKGEDHPVTFKEINLTSEIQKRITNTNDLVYMTATKNLSFLPEKYYKYMPLFTSCFTNLAGTSKTSIIDLENRIQRKTGGISFSVSVKSDPYNIAQPNFKFIMSGMALGKDSKEVYDLWHEILTDTKFSDEAEVVDKLNTLVKNLAQNQLNSIADRGHSFANSYSSSQLTPTKYINNLLGGMGQVQLVSELNKKLDAGGKEYLKDELLPILREIHQLLVGGFAEGSLTGFRYSLVSDKKNTRTNEKLMEQFEAKVSQNSVVKPNALDAAFAEFKSHGSKSILNFPFAVGYASLAKLGAPYASKDGAALQVLSQIMTFKHLHSVIRESNGAYGGGLNYDGLGGTLNFYSYRDPNSLKSVSAFLKSAEYALNNLLNGKWDSKVLQEAKLAIFQSVDAPSHVSTQGSALFLEGITDDLRQQRREMFLDVTLEDLKDVNQKYLENNTSDVMTILGDASNIGADESWNVKIFN